MALDMWGLIGGLGAGAGIGLARSLMAPDQGSLPKYNPEPLKDRLSAIDPGALSDITARRAMADRMMTGEIPDEVRQQVEMLSAEKSWHGGFGTSPRATNLTARDLGLMSLSIMQQGAEMGNKLTDFEVDMAINDANEQYKAFVARYNAKVQANTQQTNEYNNTWDSILTMGALGATSFGSNPRTPGVDPSGAGTLGAATKSGVGSVWNFFTGKPTAGTINFGTIASGTDTPYTPEPIYNLGSGNR